jgi:GAF domain-containing protein
VTERLNLRLLDLLATMADDLVEELDAQACAISRVIGDVLILVAEHVHDGSTLQQGQGYLVTDYPQTAHVLQTGMPRTLTLDDPDIDAGEASIMRELGFASLAMIRLELSGETWGLVEIYRTEPRPFTAQDILRALELTRV